MRYLAGVAAREWPASGLTSLGWLEMPVREFRIADLWATQEGVLFASLLEEREPFGGDPLPHVIAWNGEFYLEDGHHRLVRAMLDGERYLACRWLQISDESSDCTGSTGTQS